MTIWCSAASTGEEPYSIAMTVCEAFNTLTPPVQIIATDIDTNVLATGGDGVYSDRPPRQDGAGTCQEIFPAWQRGAEGLVRVRPELRQLISFKPLNLLADGWPLKGPFDVIFCRNVMIYFDKHTQRKILSRFVPLMKPDGLLFAGHSENFLYVSRCATLRGKTVYELVPGRLTRALVLPQHRVVACAAPTEPTWIQTSTSRPAYYDRTFDTDAAKVLPGEYYVTNKDMVLVTVLGSCVAACIRDRDTGVGGMNHFMLPDDGGATSTARCRPRCATAPTRWRC